MARLTERALFAAGVVAIAALVWYQMAITGDGFWMIASGRWILAHGLPTGDPFTYTSTGNWMVVNAGSCVLFAIVDKLVGLRGLMVFATIVETAAVVLLWWRSAKTPLARAALLPLALFLVQVDADDLSARGQIFGDLGFVFLLGMLARIRDGGRVHPGLMFALAIAWTNLHMSFLTTIALPGFVGAIALTSAETRTLARRFFVLSAIATGCAFITPYGGGYLRYTARSMLESSTWLFDLFASPDFHDVSWLAGPALALVLATRFRSPSPRARLDLAVLVLLLVAACRSRRYGSQLVAVEIAIAGPMLDAALPAARRFVVEATAAVAALFGAWLFVVTGAKDPLRDVPSDGAPIARAAADPVYGGVITPLHWGGYLAYEWAGSPKYMIDGRDHIELFGNGVTDDATVLWHGLPSSPAILDIYDARAVLWVRGTPLDLLLREDPHWKVAYQSDLDTVFVRAAPPPR